MHIRYSYLLLTILLVSQASFGQSSILNCSDSTFCIPSVIGLPRTKGIIIKRELVKDYGIISQSENGVTSTGEVRRNRRWEFKVKAPLLLKESFKMAMGIKYFVEEFNFDEFSSVQNSFFQSLEDRPLRSLRGDIFMIKPTKGKRYYILRMSGGLNGDYTLDNFAKKDFLKFSISPLVGWKKNDYVSYAFGLAYSYSFGRRTLYPLFAYNKSFNNQWGLESILPAEVKLRYSTLNLSNYFYLKAELNGSNYSILQSDNSSLVYLNKSEVRFLLTWEREIHDWLWFGLEAGLRENIDFDLAKSPDINADVVVDNQVNEAFIFSFSLFMVPPRKLLSK